MKIKEEELAYAYITQFCDPEKQILLTNHYHGGWEADIMIIHQDGISHEIEIKCSKSDFKNDFKKQYTHPQTGRTYAKHEQISQGDYPCNFFSFLLPMGMIPLDELPEHCGLIEYYHNVDTWETEFYPVREPKLLHQQRFWELFDQETFLRKIAVQLLYRKFELKARTETLILKHQKFGNNGF